MLCIKLPVSIFERSNPKLRAHYFMVFGWHPFSCTIRYTEFELVPVKKILISNSHPIELYPKDESGAIFRRLKSLHINGKTWKQPEVTAAERTPLAPIIAQRVNHFSEGSQPTQLVNPPPHIAENSNAPVVPIPYPNYWILSLCESRVLVYFATSML